MCRDAMDGTAPDVGEAANTVGHSCRIDKGMLMPAINKRTVFGIRHFISACPAEERIPLLFCFRFVFGL